MCNFCLKNLISQRYHRKNDIGEEKAHGHSWSQNQGLLQCLLTNHYAIDPLGLLTISLSATVCAWSKVRLYLLIAQQVSNVTQPWLHISTFLKCIKLGPMYILLLMKQLDTHQPPHLSGSQGNKKRKKKPVTRLGFELLGIH